MTKRTTKRDREKAEARADLETWIKPGDTVYTLMEHVSRSGMQREIRVLVPYTRDGGGIDFIHPNHAAARLIGVRQGKRDGLIVGGCGMDMGSHIVYELAAELFPDGFGCVGKGCPSNDHSNGDRDYTPHVAGAAEARCGSCDGVGRREGRSYDCSVCEGKGVRTGHWHKSGGYALSHRWL